MQYEIKRITYFIQDFMLRKTGGFHVWNVFGKFLIEKMEVSYKQRVFYLGDLDLNHRRIICYPKIFFGLS